MNLAIFEPDIPQNTGAMIRICSCFDVDIDIIHPASFVLSEKSLNRVAMDYIKNVKISEFDDWKDYMAKRNGRKIMDSKNVIAAIALSSAVIVLWSLGPPRN